jgi:hypothetical protein
MVERANMYSKELENSRVEIFVHYKIFVFVHIYNNKHNGSKNFLNSHSFELVNLQHKPGSTINRSEHWLFNRISILRKATTTEMNDLL